MSSRKVINAKLQLKVFKRDKHKCQICGKSPSLFPELSLEVDHIVPVSKGGDNNLENLQTLCILCNRGKGNCEDLDNTINDKIINLLNKINPKILEAIKSKNYVRVVANDFDFIELQRLNKINKNYEIIATNNCINGYHAMFSWGIYTIEDNHGQKIAFHIRSLS